MESTAQKKSNLKSLSEDSLQWCLIENHNEYLNRSDHPLKHQHHCWLLHEYYDHPYLAWQDVETNQNLLPIHH